MTEQKRFDLTRYRTPELFDQFFSLLDVRATLVSWLRWLIVIIAVIVGATAYFFYGVVSTNLLVVALTYAAGAGLAVGNLLCVCMTIDKALGNVGGIVDITLDTVRVASEDFENAKAGEMPTAAKLLRATYRDVTFPIIEKILAERVWFVGKPMLWVYRRTLGRIADYAIEKMPDEKLTDRGAEQELERHMDHVEMVHKNRDRIQQSVTWIGEKSKAAPRGVHKWAMRPLWFLATLVGIGLITPLVVGWILAR